MALIDTDTVLETIGRSAAYEDTTLDRIVYYSYLLRTVRGVLSTEDWYIDENHIISLDLNDTLRWLFKEGEIKWRGVEPESHTHFEVDITDLTHFTPSTLDDDYGTETITKLFTYDRDPSAPFAVTPSSAVVPNLDADKLDGYHATDLALVGHTHAHGDLTGVGVNDHHNQVHDFDGSDHSGLTITGPLQSGDVLQYSGSAWVDRSLAEAGISATGHTHAHGDLTGVGTDDHHNQTHAFDGSDHSGLTITGPLQSGDVLQYSGTAWVDRTLTEAGIAAASHTHAQADVTDWPLTHERGGLEFNASAVAIGDVIAGSGAGTMALVTAAGHSTGDVLTIQAGGGVDWEAPPGGGGDDEKVAVDALATPDYIGASSSTGVLRTGSLLSYADGGDYVTLNVNEAGLNLGNFGTRSIDNLSDVSLSGITDNELLVYQSGIWINYTLSEAGIVPTSRNLTAGTGLSGGGTLAADRTFNLDIAGLTSTASVTGSTDYVAVDVSGVGLRKVLLDDLPGGGGGAPVDAQYIVATSDATLTAERVLTAGESIDVDNGTPGVCTVSCDIATTVSRGVASFSPTYFDVTGGNVTIGDVTGPTVLGRSTGLGDPAWLTMATLRGTTMLDGTTSAGSGAGSYWAAGKIRGNPINPAISPTDGQLLTYVSAGPYWDAVDAGSSTDEKVAVDSLATADYLGNTGADGCLRVDSTLSYTDGGNYVTLGVNAIAASQVTSGLLALARGGTNAALTGASQIITMNLGNTALECSGATLADIPTYMDDLFNCDASLEIPAQGSIIVGNSTPAWAELAKGTNDQILRMATNDPTWEDMPGIVRILHVEDPAVGDRFLIGWVPRAATMVKVWGEVSETAGSVDINIEQCAMGSVETAGTDILSSDLNLDDNGANTTTFASSGAITAERWLVVTVSGVTGAAAFWLAAEYSFT